MKSESNKANFSHVAFFPLLLLIFSCWVFYRYMFKFPVWFDETIGKAIFFGLPVWFYVFFTKAKDIAETFSPRKLQNGLLLGITVGGCFGFVFSIISILQKGGVVQAVDLFSNNSFWYEFAMAIFTGFWETLLFYSFALTVIRNKFSNWSAYAQVMLAALIFLAFHVPNTILRYEISLVLPQLFVLFLFALGQGFLFYTRRNAYALVLSHAIWGMVLLVHFGIN